MRLNAQRRREREMTRTSTIGGPLTAALTLLLTTFALNSPAVHGQDTEEPAPALEAPTTGEQREYQDAIAEIESSEGAYAGQLPESLLGLGLNLQAQGRHVDAIKALRRGVHLARINEGLYCTQQIPLLQGEITSYRAIGDYAAADERQNYLYRVQTRSLPSGEARASAFMQHAKWHYDAYQLGLEEQGHNRLMAMMEHYQLAAQDVIAREGELSPRLLPPLHGMLQAQYLISRYEVPEQAPVFTQDDPMPQIDESAMRFRSYRTQSFQKGNAIIEAITSIEKNQPAPDSARLAETMVMLGDWRLWNGRTDSALEAYREAETQLARDSNARAQIQRLFAEPVALPAFAEASPLPPVVDPQQADVLLSFGVSEAGRVEDLERLDENEELDGPAYRLMKRLRKTTFRPRFEAGHPVETAKLVKAFNLQ
jgi:tetratricopeptide (TPR) repeat protein